MAATLTLQVARLKVPRSLAVARSGCVAFALIGVLCVLSGQADTKAREYVVAASLHQRNLELTDLDCLSLKRAVIFGIDYLSETKIREVISTKLPSKVTLEKERLEDCRAVLSFDILRQTIKAVKYYGMPARILMSFNACERTSDGKLNTRACLSKNVYLFTQHPKPLEVFEIGLGAFIRSQDVEWTLMKIQVGNDAL